MSTTGADRIRAAFAKKAGAALMPYFTLGYPDAAQSGRIVQACCESGADIMELGVPFSDPLADGPTIQASTQAALKNGMNVRGCLAEVRRLRAAGIETPFILMGYINPILRYGLDEFVRDSHAAGVDGYIIPDLPQEESGDLQKQCDLHGLGLVHMLAPNSPTDRVERVLAADPPFVYMVSLTGVTGARDSLPAGLANFIRRVRARADSGLPLAVGFGIGTPAQAQTVGRTADGVIVGSALVRCVQEALESGEDPAGAAGEFVGSLRDALHAL